MKNQPQLPFTIEGNTATRDQVRSLSKNVDHLRKISLSQIRIRPGFNARVQGDIPDDLWEKILMIPELAEGIYISNGPADDIIGDFYRIDEYFYVTEGERRVRALRYLLNTKTEEHPKGRDTYPNGQAIDEVRVILNSPGTTDLERKVKIGTTGNKLPLTQMQWAYYYLDLKTEFDQTSQQVADLFHVSRAKIDMYIMATELPKDVQIAIDEDKIKISNAISEYRAAKKKKDNPGLEDETTPSQEAQQRKKDKEGAMSGDEKDFEQQDNSVQGVSSMGGAKEDRSSGSITIGKDSIYKDQEDTSKWKQFLNRHGVLLTDCLLAAEGYVELAQTKLIERLKMEYTIQVK
jgi:hypothetical protein